MSCFDMKAIFSSFFGFMIGAFFNESTDIYDILHYPSLLLLSILWVNLQLTCSQTNPQIQFHSYHRGSPHMTLKVFPQSKREFSTKPLLLPAWDITARFPPGRGPGTNNFLYHQTKAYEQYHMKQIKIRLSKWLSNHSHGI